jgi:hypothetical protein
LILDGMGALGSNDINTKPISNKLRHNKMNMQVLVVQLDDGFVMPPQIAMALKKGIFSACIILGWGSGNDIDIGLTFANTDAFQKNLVQWVAQGAGQLIVQGKWILHATEDWLEWFGLTISD